VDYLLDGPNEYNMISHIAHLYPAKLILKK